MKGPPPPEYALEQQVGFLMRRANQRHLALFARRIPDLTATQFAALAKLCTAGPMSQNALGRATAIDAATIKGVVDRLRRRGHVGATADREDRRRMVLAVTDHGRATFDTLVLQARTITADTLAPLTPAQQRTFLSLLSKLV